MSRRAAVKHDRQANEAYYTPYHATALLTGVLVRGYLAHPRAKLLLLLAMRDGDVR